jgi:hypothetical protein
VEYLPLILLIPALIFIVSPLLIFGFAFWIVRRCARRWQTVFWEAGVYGTGAGLGMLALYSLTRVATAGPIGVWVAPTEGLPLATMILVATWALALLYLARKRAVVEPAPRRSLRRSVVGAYAALVLVAVWTMVWLHELSLRHEAAAQPDPRALRAIADSVWARHDTTLAVTLAGNAATSEDVLRQLASHRSLPVRAAVARNETASAQILAGLAGDAEPQVAAAVAGNGHTPPDQLRLLADPQAPDSRTWQSEDWSRRNVIDAALAANPATPQDVLQLLVQRWAPVEVMTCPITSALIDNPAISEDLLRRIAELNSFVNAKAGAALPRRGNDKPTPGRD